MKRSIAVLALTTSLVFAGGALAQTLDKVSEGREASATSRASMRISAVPAHR